MPKIIIGCDPDSTAHGIAVYVGGRLETLKSMPLIEVVSLFRELESKNPILHIENVCENDAAFVNRKAFKSKQAYEGAIKSRNRKLGKCQQAQVELERFAEYYGIEIVRHKISKNWKSADAGKKQFERLTGWTGRSNEDTRSAAYFGFLGCR